MVRKTLNILFYVVGAFYILIMLDLFFRFSYIFDVDRVVSRSYNLIPFRTIWDYAIGNMQVSQANAVSNILLNIVVFIPYGLYVQTIKKNKAFITSALTVIATAVAIELIQFLFGLGASDIDDVLLNSMGGIIGMLLYRLLRKICADEGRTRATITILSLIVGVPVIFFYFTTVFGHMRL